jgi:hypothetical protein
MKTITKHYLVPEFISKKVEPEKKDNLQDWMLSFNFTYGKYFDYAISCFENGKGFCDALEECRDRFNSISPIKENVLFSLVSEAQKAHSKSKWE